MVNFDQVKIAKAIGKAFRVFGPGNDDAPSRLAKRVAKEAAERFSESIPGVEDIQDIVERVLIEEGYTSAAKAYILYRQKRDEVRRQNAIWEWLTILSFPSMPWRC